MAGDLPACRGSHLLRDSRRLQHESHNPVSLLMRRRIYTALSGHLISSVEAR